MIGALLLVPASGHAGGCAHAYNRCSLQELLNYWFPETTGDPNHSLKRKDGMGHSYEFPQLARYIDNDVSDFSWDKVFILVKGTSHRGREEREF